MWCCILSLIAPSPHCEPNLFAYDPRVTQPRVPGARLSSSYQEAVLWQAQATPPTIEAHRLPAEAEVVIIGAGYCGLSAGRVLGKAGQSVVVVERDPLGFGASTRNGGMVLPELKAGPSTLEAKYGSIGRQVYREVNDAFDHTESLIANEQIDCDYRRDGQLYLAHNHTHVAPLQAMAAEHGSELGEPVFWVCLLYTSPSPRDS